VASSQPTKETPRAFFAERPGTHGTRAAVKAAKALGVALTCLLDQVQPCEQRSPKGVGRAGDVGQPRRILFTPRSWTRTGRKMMPADRYRRTIGPSRK